jgi:hypothetical protein
LIKKDVYQDRILSFGLAEEKFRKITSKFPFYRLSVFLISAFAFYFAFEISTLLAIAVALLFLTLFFIVTKYDLAYNKKRRHLGLLKRINENELKSIQGDYKIYANGSRFQSAQHPYASDLDIFGNASIFQFINRTTSNAGAGILAEMLQAPAKAEEIILRQDAIKNLSGMIDWRQEFQASGIEFDEPENEQKEIFSWLKEKSTFLHHKTLTLLSIVLPIITICLIVSTFFGIPKGYAFLAIILQGSIIFFHSKNINESYQNISRKVELLKQYSALIKIIENGDFTSEKLINLKKNFYLGDSSASENLNKLSTYVNYLDFRLNIYFWIPLNLITFWDIHWIRKAEAWREAHHHKVLQWFSALGEFEALSSFANLTFNNPDWVFPEIQTSGFIMEATDAGHPLLKPEKRVNNTFSINGKGKIMLITGSNMAGKSTFLRTVGVNAVLALAGGPVCAETLKISPIQVYTSMRIIDSLEENASSFYAELKRLREIIEAVKHQDNVFFLLDEILRGTNSNDRHIGSKALIKQMARQNGNGIIATHDLELGKLEEELPQHVDNYSFDVQIEEGERLFFDYKLHTGICKSLNASILMKKMGIEV